VWGIQAGWSAPTSGNWWESEPVDLAKGTYTATITVNPPYVALFGIPADQASTAVQVIVRPAAADERPRRQAARPAADPAAQPAAERPAGAGTVPAGPQPDLRSLPAWGIEIGGEEGEAVHDYLAFNATVWTAGRSPLVIDGFRRDENMMDAYQYFYDPQGNQTGYAQVGTMQWDPREGHQHWRFTDFPQYRLLDANQQVAMRPTATCTSRTRPTTSRTEKSSSAASRAGEPSKSHRTTASRADRHNDHPRQPGGLFTRPKATQRASVHCHEAPEVVC
jgi:hypothetical protein